MGTRDQGTDTRIGDSGAVNTDGWTLPALVHQAAAAHGDREFLSFEDGRTLSFAELDRQTDRLATALADLGLRPGDRLLGLLTNSLEFMLLMIATHKRRAIFVPVNTDLRGTFLEHQVNNSEPRIVAVDHGLLERFDDIEPGSLDASKTAASESDIQATILIDDGDYGVGAGGVLMGTEEVSIEELLDTEVRPEAVLQAESSDVCTIMYTSGTTGPAKGVLMPQAHCYLFGLGTARSLQITPDDRFYCCMPLFHANGLFMQVFASLHAGASVYVEKRFSAGKWLDTVRRHRITLTNALGVMPEFIWRSPATDRDRDHLLRAVIALPVAAEWAAAFEERFGVRIMQGYGMTEVNMVAYTSFDDPVMSGCAGRPLADYFEVIVADPETDQPIAPNETG